VRPGDGAARGRARSAGGGRRRAGRRRPTPTPYETATSYNNFYEFGTDKEDPKANAGSLRPAPWSVAVEGLVKRPAAYRSTTCSRG
jgi:sulfoxide reductase catalytic subunit YedY